MELIASASTTVEDVPAALAAVDRGLSNPGELADARRDVAQELFHGPGRATERAVAELYALMELEPSEVVGPASIAPLNDGAGERAVTR